jgi:ribosomal protein S18 acetylase RimI-like enzyme
LNGGPEQRIVDVEFGNRKSLEPILKESFEGWYLSHSLKTLREIERVRVVKVEGRMVGLSMLKSLGDGAGYVYYLAVVRAQRRKGLGGELIEDAIMCFRKQGERELYVSVENKEAARLFSSKGFAKIDFGGVSRKHGVFRAFSMYRSMLSVPGESLLRLDLIPGYQEPTLSSRA